MPVTDCNILPSMARLRWQCRRGMLELDLLLEEFLDKAYARLEPRQRALFVDLLHSPDQQLYDYFLGEATPADPEVAQLVARIRDAVAA